MWRSAGRLYKPLSKRLLKPTVCPPLLPEHQWLLFLFCLLKYKFLSLPQSNPKPFWRDARTCSFQAFSMKGEERCLSCQQRGIRSKETKEAEWEVPWWAWIFFKGYLQKIERMVCTEAKSNGVAWTYTNVVKDSNWKGPLSLWEEKAKKIRNCGPSALEQWTRLHDWLTDLCILPFSNASLSPLVRIISNWKRVYPLNKIEA